MALATATPTTLTRTQNTLQGEVSFSGIGIHTGSVVSLKFCPAEAGTGIVFKRVDLPGAPVIPAAVEYVTETSRSTTIGIGDVKIHTVEHVLSALRAYKIDNLIIEISNIEPPIANGSSDTFVEMIEEAGLCPQESTMPILRLQEPVYWSDGEIQVVGLPSDEYRISYTLNYPESEVLKAQFHSAPVTGDYFKREIAPCRTFAKYEEVSMLIDHGLIKGGSLDNAVIIKENAVFSKGGLFFPDEMVRHKILDVIGDLSLVGFDFQAHIIALRSGHAGNVAFAKKLYEHLTREKIA